MLVLQGRVAAHKIGAVLLQIFSGILLPKIIETGARLIKVLQK